MKNEEKMDEVNLKNYNRKLKIKELYFKFLDYRRHVERGNYWMTTLDTYIPYQKLLNYAVTFYGVDVIVRGKSIWWMIGGAVAYVIGQVGFEVIKWIIAKKDYEKGVWKYDIEWSQKVEKYQPAFNETKETLKEICNHLGIKHHFNDL